MFKQLFFLALLVPVSIFSQSLSKPQARTFLESAWKMLQTNDTAGFIRLWDGGSSDASYTGRKLSKVQLNNIFAQLKEHLDTAIMSNMKVDDIEISEEQLKDTDTKYWIQGWFKYENRYYKGFGFYLAHVNGKWVARDYPSSSELRRPKK